MDSGVSRWIAFACIPLLTALCGVIFTSSIISGLYNDAKDDLFRYVAAVGGTIHYFGVPAGLFCDKWGPSSTVLVGGVLAFVGYEVVYCIMGGFIPKDFTLLTACFFIGAQSQAWFDTAALVTMLDSFPAEYHGHVIGITKSLHRLSIGVFAQLYLSVFHGNGQRFLGALPFMILSVASPVSVALAAIADQSLYRPPQPPPPCLLRIAYLLTIAMILFLLTTSLIQLGVPSGQISILAAVGIGLLYVAWGILPLLATVHERADEHLWLTAAEKAARGQTTDVTLHESLLTLDFYTLFFCVAVSAGSGSLVLSHVSDVVASFATATTDIGHDTAVILCLISTGDAMGRLASGLTSEAYRQNFFRLLFLAFMLTLMAIVNGCLALTTSQSTIFPLFFLSGFSFGCIGALFPSLTIDLFGVGSFGAIYNTLQTGYIVGPIIMFSLMSSTHFAGQGGSCKGTMCYIGPFLCSAGICLVAAMCAMVLLCRELPAFSQPLANEDTKAAVCKAAFTNLVSDIRVAFSEATTTNSFGAEDPFPPDSVGLVGFDTQSFNSELVLQSFNPMSHDCAASLVSPTAAPGNAPPGYYPSYRSSSPFFSKPSPPAASPSVLHG